MDGWMDHGHGVGVASRWEGPNAAKASADDKSLFFFFSHRKHRERIFGPRANSSSPLFPHRYSWVKRSGSKVAGPTSQFSHERQFSQADETQTGTGPINVIGLPRHP